MKFEEQEIPGVFLLQADPFVDDRGAFYRQFCAKEFEARGLDSFVAQGNISINPKIGTLRGFHYQLAPYEESKTLSCLSGAIYDIVVDLRPNSPMFLRWISVEIEAKKYLGLHLPKGCANAWMTLMPDTIIHYYMGNFYNEKSYHGFNYEDPAFNFRWPDLPKVISEKDRALPNFDVSKLVDL
jgi:dTDP-4-dehydrorhamnose 3,5-epimerase